MEPNHTLGKEPAGVGVWVPGSVTKTLVWVYKTNMATSFNFLACSGCPEPFPVILGGHEAA